MKYHKFSEDCSSAVQDIGRAISSYAEDEALKAMMSIIVATLIATHRKEAAAYLSSFMFSLKQTYEIATTKGRKIEQVEAAFQ